MILIIIQEGIIKENKSIPEKKDKDLVNLEKDQDHEIEIEIEKGIDKETETEIIVVKNAAYLTNIREEEKNNEKKTLIQP